MTNGIDRSTYICDQSECPMKTSGLCLEGLSVSDCPHAHLTEIEADEEEDLIPEITDYVESENATMLFSGDELSLSQVVDITYANPTRLIVIMGEPNCGKTTILASLFDLFQKGTFGPYWFAGSRTQIGFEKRCHLARMASGRQTPDTERTRSNDFSFLHLALRKDTDPVQHLLFTDVSGERFRLARDSAQEMEQLTILGQADQIFCVLDGEQLARNSTRQISKANLVTLLNRIQQNNNISNQKGIYLLINKWDIVVEQKQEEAVDRIIISSVFNRFPKLIQGVINVSARPMMNNQIKLGYGYESMLSLCITDNSIQHTHHFEKTHLSREFDRFALRY